MLKIAGASAAPPVENELPVPEALPEESLVPEASGAMGSPKFSADKIDPFTVVYKDPEMGPFECQNCVFFEAPNACSVVLGDIHPNGVCNLFTSGASGPEGEVPEEEAPELTNEESVSESPDVEGAGQDEEEV